MSRKIEREIQGREARGGKEREREGGREESKGREGGRGKSGCMLMEQMSSE